MWSSCHHSRARLQGLVVAASKRSCETSRCISAIVVPRGHRASFPECLEEAGKLRSSRMLLGFPSSFYRPFSSSADSAGTNEQLTPSFPPNLKLDPKSKFSKQKHQQQKSQTKRTTEATVESGAGSHENDSLESSLVLSPTRTTNTTSPAPSADRLHVNVYTLFAPEYNNQVGTIWLDPKVFGQYPIRVDFLKRAVDYYRHHKRGRRTAKTKTISEVSGSGRKLRPQKGQGRARVGHSRPPHFRGGAKAHGPKNTTNYANYKLNKKLRKQALLHALSQKVLEGNLLIVDQLYGLPTHKTNDLAKLLRPWNIGTDTKYTSSALILDYCTKDDFISTENETTLSDSELESKVYNSIPTNLWVASQNLQRVTVGNHHAASVYDILKHKRLVLTLAAVQKLEERYKNFF